MKDKIFIDSNIFAYAYTDDDSEKHELSRIPRYKAVNVEGCEIHIFVYCS
jgi:predicted nucleic acid-binding protein